MLNFRCRFNLLLDVNQGYEASLMNWLLRVLKEASSGVENGCWRLNVNMMMNDVKQKHFLKKKLRINQFWQKLYHSYRTRSKKQFIWMMLSLEVHLARDLWESFEFYIASQIKRVELFICRSLKFTLWTWKKTSTSLLERQREWKAFLFLTKESGCRMEAECRSRVIAARCITKRDMSSS